MNKLEELQSEIETLPANQFQQLRNWFADKDWELWDQQIQADADSGKLDFLLDEARAAKSHSTLRDF